MSASGSGSGSSKKRRRLDPGDAYYIDKTSNNNDTNSETVTNQMELCDVARLRPSTTATSGALVGDAATVEILNLVDMLRRDDCPDLQWEAACCLTNIFHDGKNNKAAAEINNFNNATRSSQDNNDEDDDDDCLTQIVTGAIPQLVRLLGSSPSFHVREQVVCALGNMARDTVKCRDAILEAGVLPPLLEVLDPLSTLLSSCGEDDTALLDGGVDATAELQQKQDRSYHCTSLTTSTSSGRRRSMQCYGTWTLAGLCLNKPSPPDFNVIRTALPTLAKLLQYSSDELVLKQACTTVASLSSGSMEKKQAVLAAGICPKLVALLDDHHKSSTSSLSSRYAVQEAAVRTLAIVMSGNPIHHPHQTQMVIQHVLDCNDGSVLPRF